MPPAATIGRSTCARTSCRSASSPMSPGAASSKLPRCAPASTPCTTRASAPARAAVRASAGVVTVTHVSAPASRSSASTSRGGQPKANETTGTRSRDDELELRLPGVVVVLRPAQRDPDPRGLLRQPGRVALDLPRIAVAGRREDVHPEGPGGERADRRDLLAHRLRRLVAGREEPEPTRLADRGRELGRRGAAGHRRRDDRMPELDHAPVAGSWSLGKPRWSIASVCESSSYCDGVLCDQYVPRSRT